MDRGHNGIASGDAIARLWRPGANQGPWGPAGQADRVGLSTQEQGLRWDLSMRAEGGEFGNLSLCPAPMAD